VVRARILVLLAAALLNACGPPNGSADSVAPTPSGSVTRPTSPVATALRYVALGDSYTIGTSVALDERWPNQLIAALGSAGPTLDLVANLGVNGFTSRDVLEVEMPRLAALQPEFVTLLIGVNDVVQRVSAETYRRNVTSILDDLAARVGAERILVITTPDYTVAPAGGDFGDPSQQAAAIRTNNEILTGLAAGRRIATVDIYDLSQRAASDRSLVAADGLHPSGAQYALWVTRVVPAVESLLGR